MKEKYLRLFQTITDYENLDKELFDIPSVSYIEETGGCFYIPAEENNDPFNGHEYVDLGLPSGTLWAKCNVGANNEYEAGNYFAWGEVEPKTLYTWNTYKWGSSQNSMTKYNLSDNKTVLDLEDDAASVNMGGGGGWRMPTYDELMELEENTTFLWINDYDLRELTSKINGSKLYIPNGGYRAGSNLMIPKSGFWWSSSLFYLDNSRCPASVYSTSWFPNNFVNNGMKADYHSGPQSGRLVGYNVRGVIKPNK